MLNLRHLACAVLSALICPAHSVPAAEPAADRLPATSAPELQITPELAWKHGGYNDMPVTFLEVSLLVQGASVVGTTACGDLKVDLVEGDDGQTIEKFTHLAGMMLADPKITSIQHPKNGVRLTISLYDVPPLQQLSEVRGSFALQNGGRQQFVLLKHVLQHGDEDINDVALNDLGITVRLKRTIPSRETEAEKRLRTSITPADAADPREVLTCRIESRDHPVVGIKFADAKGKLLPAIPLMWDYGNSINEAQFGFKETLPDDCQLLLTVHRDAQVVRVPFALSKLAIPPKKQRRFATEGMLLPVR